MRNLVFPFLFAAVIAGGCGASSSESTATPASTEPKFTDIVMTDDESARTPKKEFKPDTATIWVFFGLENVKSGSKIKGVWICDKAPGIEPNFKIDEATVDIGVIENSGNFSISKPTNGWPVGDYHVELYAGDKQIDRVDFKVVP